MTGYQSSPRDSTTFTDFASQNANKSQDMDPNSLEQWLEAKGEFLSSDVFSVTDDTFRMLDMNLGSESPQALVCAYERVDLFDPNSTGEPLRYDCTLTPSGRPRMADVSGRREVAFLSQWLM